MNKPVTQLELMPAAAKSPAPSLDPKLIADLTASGIDPALVSRVAIATSLVDRVLAAPGPDDDFDWATDDAVVVKPRPGVAIYTNKSGDVVIRTQNTDDPGDDDHFAFVNPEGLPAVIKALKDCLP